MFKFIRFVLAGIGHFLKTQWNQYTPLGQFLWSLALVAIAVDAGISWEYGSSMTLLHAAGFALVAIAFAVLPDVASMEWSKGKKQAAMWLAAACFPLGVVAYQSHVGYGAGIRIGDINQVSFQNAVATNVQDDAGKLNDKIALLEKRREALDGEMAALVSKSVGGWTVTTRPSSAAELEGLISAKQLEASNEAKRVRCGSKCELFNNQLAHLQALRAKAAEIERNDTEHTATITALSSARDKVAENKPTNSTVYNQTDVFVKLYNLAVGRMDADKAIITTAAQREFTNTAIMGVGSLAFMILAPVLNFAAGRNRKPEFLKAWTEPDPEFHVELPKRPLIATAESDTREVHHHHHGKDIWKDFKLALESYQPPHVRIAA